MADPDTILLYIADRALLSSLQFALSVEGFQVGDGAGGGFDSRTAWALVIDQEYREDGLAALRELRATGCQTAAILIATNPTSRLLASASAVGAELVEKPLLGDDLTRALRGLVALRKAA